VKLPHPDVRSYVRFLAEVVVRVCRSFGVDSWADEQRIGVWSRRGKLASFGIGLRRWVAFHGVALNVSRAAEEPFSFIVPCRTVGLAVSSLEGEGTGAPSVAEVAQAFAERFVAAWAEYWEHGRPEWKFDEDIRLG
jgi:lipoyl(octanoyl) transferase